MLYFAYGSNLHPARLRDRTPSAQLITTGFTCSRQLVFHKVGRDGSAKCDALLAEDPDSTVFGAVFQLDERDISTLDRYEALGVGYQREILSVSTATGTLQAFAYIAQAQYVDPSLTPFHWYKQLVIAGAKLHQFPKSYIASIAAVRSTPDPQLQRATKNLGVLPDFIR
ncbi:MAG: gamma-glutamylcyclotransferase family protein [Cyanobacteria bacterium P01_E01_bin.34]